MTKHNHQLATNAVRGPPLRVDRACIAPLRGLLANDPQYPNLHSHNLSTQVFFLAVLKSKWYFYSPPITLYLVKEGSFLPQ
jgi:hypothetical protein